MTAPLEIIFMAPARPSQEQPGRVAWFTARVAGLIEINGCALLRTAGGWRAILPRAAAGKKGSRALDFASSYGHRQICDAAVQAWTNRERP